MQMTLTPAEGKHQSEFGGVKEVRAIDLPKSQEKLQSTGIRKDICICWIGTNN